VLTTRLGGVMLRTVQCRPAPACARKSPPRVHSKETRQDKTRLTPHCTDTGMTARPPQVHGSTMPLLLLLVLISLVASQAMSSSSPFSSSRSPPRASISASAFASSASSSFFPTRARQHPQQQAQGRGRRRRSSASLQMRDASMTRDFSVGDIVRVEPGVQLDGMDWGGLEGTVTTTWVK
jgi:hypothetical protein